MKKAKEYFEECFQNNRNIIDTIKQVQEDTIRETIEEFSITQKVRGNIHGHNHENRIDNPKYINVSCDLLKYQPKTIEELLEIQDKLFNIKWS